MTSLVDTLVLPPGGPVMLGLLGILLLAWRRGLALALLVCGAVAGYLCSLPLTAAVLAAALQWPDPVDTTALAGARAIVVLAGDLYVDAPEYGGDSVGPYTLGRARYAAHLARRTALPVLASGGIVDGEGDPPEAELMRGVLESELGLRDVWVETRSQSTWDNARHSAPLLRARGIDTVALVTHAAHMPRAVAAFRHQGITVVPAPTLFFPSSPRPRDLYSWLPGPGAGRRVHYLLHEALGRLWYSWRTLP